MSLLQHLPEDKLGILTYASSAVLAFIAYLGSIRQLGGFPVLTAWTFFTKRYDFIWANFAKNSSLHFKFQVLQVCSSIFFDTKSLDFIEGYKILMGASPSLDDIDVKAKITKAFLALPTLFDDVNRRMELWGKEGRMDPFKNIYDLVFQMTTRMATCDELSKDLQAIDEIQQLYWTLEKSATPTAFCFLGESPSADAIDLLIGQGLSDPEIVQFILSVVFAGVINTGINSCWALVFLASHPEWKAKAKAEIGAMIEKHTNTTSGEPLHKRLAAVPVSAWEDEMPVMELIIRETLRIVVSGTALRRNLVEDLTVSRARFAPGREEDKNSTFAFLGWGAGRHPCTGMKVAKLEIKLIVAMMLAGYDFDVVDKAGKTPKQLPQPDRNDIHQARPIGEQVYLQFKRVVE
ncbi:cytochrome P450 [Pholiota molesta]|nr:cytochrome P450 [Pholiota molesta]